METITPRDNGELVAIGRMQVLGALARRQLQRGELRAELHKLSQQAVLLPGEERPRRLSVTTLERWFYALRKYGLAGLRPKQRGDRGRARALTAEQKALLLNIRGEFPQAAVTLILATLIRDGRLDAGCISAATVRRYFAEEGVQKAIAAQSARPPRQRWQAERPGMLWHADVCHGPAMEIDGRSRPLRIHALLDDASRYIVAFRVAHTECESDMLALLVQAWRSWGASELLYVDNGATYRVVR
jgi:putative transposase